MGFVLDASVTMAWAFDDEDHPLAALVLRRMLGEDAVAPWIWWFEVRNALAISEKKGRGTEEKTTAVLGHLAELPVSIDVEPDEAAIFRLTRKHGLTFYDAAYLELAQRKGIALATLDRELEAAARKESVITLRTEAE
jgi:predicted nucleic acid-binding protein